MKRTALLAAFFSTCALPVFAHEAFPPGHVHGSEFATQAVPYVAGILIAGLLVYLARKSRNA